ncbi:MAG: permease-like cell division protein FtsX [Gammaproteobacteria bacterium]|nr:permease-like cell division protein FtsX [Gammaproteobacteria bacterium]
MSKKTRAGQPTDQIRNVIGSWFVDHLRALISSLGQITRNPVGSFMTIAVIAISLTLPAGFYVFLENARIVTADWEGGAQITVFLHTAVNDEQGQQLTSELAGLPMIKSARFVSRDKALEEYRDLSGFAEALDVLEENPLPSLILVEPELEGNNPDRVLENLKAREEVDLAILDQKWLQRLFVIIEIVERVIYIFSSLLAVAVLLIIGNTIRLGIYNRRQEIEIIKLFGGANSFIQRPFLYSGFWFGLIGSLMAWLLVTACLQFLKGPINTLAGLYASQFQLVGIGPAEGGILVAIGTGLGFLGSWIAVQRHIREIEPT